MRSLRIAVYIAVVIGYVVYTTFFPEHTTVARAVSFGLLATAAILRKIHSGKNDDILAPEPIRSLNLAQRESAADPQNTAR
jgi:hypothetical protein